MEKIGRNNPCPCGSGKKYKRCCLMRADSATGMSPRRVSRKLGLNLSCPPEILHHRACGFYQTGDFWDCIDICLELDRVGASTNRSTELHLLAYAALSGNPQGSIYECKSVEDKEVPDIELVVGAEGILRQVLELESPKPDFPTKFETTHPLENLYLHLRSIKGSNVLDSVEIEQFRALLKENLWIVPSDHPAVAINLAHWLVHHEVDQKFAMELTSCCMGWRYCFKRIEDLLALAHLMSGFQMPCVFWTNLLSLYCDFAANDDFKQEIMLQSGLNERLIQIRRGEINWVEGEFHKYCASHGLPDRDAIMELYLKAIKTGVNEDSNRFPGSGSYCVGPYEAWLSEEMFQMRHPWFCLLQQRERNFVRNADTAFCACITDDFSFACSQWWRCIESVLKRKLIEPLGLLLDANPSWAETDAANPRVLKRDRLFAVELTDRSRRRCISLAQMLMILEKVMNDVKRGRKSDSVVRQKAVEHLRSRMSEFRWVTGELDDVADFRSALTPHVFTEHTIKTFRNAASHDQPMTFAEAAVGRLIAIRILDYMHYPRYCVDKKLQELKQELRSRSKETEQ